MMRYIEIVPFEHEIKGNDYIRRCGIKRKNGDVEKDYRELWFTFDRSIIPPNDDDCDSYLLAVIMEAMQENRNVIVRGTVSKQLLSNLVEYQAVWNKWLPAIYSSVNILADSVKNDAMPLPGAVCAFSGGVDATFSVWRHSQNKCSHRTQEIKLCSIVHGFDIPLNDDTAFQNTVNRSQKLLNNVQIKLEPVRTNFRKISNVKWTHVCSCALVAALNNFKNMAGTCIIGSNEPYDSLLFGVGCSPITDYLLSTGDFNVIHDGASHSRTEKVKEISGWKAATENLRVCWQGDLKDRNCGKCEKCLRTKLNFLATNNPVPGCFPHSNLTEDLKNVVLGNDVVRGEWRQIYEYAQKNGINAPWVKQLYKIQKKRKPVIEWAFPGGSVQREQAKKLLMKFRRN